MPDGSNYTTVVLHPLGFSCCLAHYHDHCGPECRQVLRESNYLRISSSFLILSAFLQTISSYLACLLQYNTIKFLIMCLFLIFYFHYSYSSLFVIILSSSLSSLFYLSSLFHKKEALQKTISTHLQDKKVRVKFLNRTLSVECNLRAIKMTDKCILHRQQILV